MTPALIARQHRMNQIRRLSQPITIPAVARPSPAWVGGKERVSLRAILPVTMAAMPPITGRKKIPTIPEIKLMIASVLVGSSAGDVFSGRLGCSMWLLLLFIWNCLCFALLPYHAQLYSILPLTPEENTLLTA